VFLKYALHLNLWRVHFSAEPGVMALMESSTLDGPTVPFPSRLVMTTRSKVEGFNMCSNINTT
jgi:hypothetical protein